MKKEDRAKLITDEEFNKQLDSVVGMIKIRLTVETQLLTPTFYYIQANKLKTINAIPVPDGIKNIQGTAYTIGSIVGSLGDQVLSCFFSGECWVSQNKEISQASKDPRRKDGVTITGRTLDFRNNSYQAKVIRSKKSTTLEDAFLSHYPQEVEEFKDNILEKFFEGFIANYDEKK